jgi:hypothetical protein
LSNKKLLLCLGFVAAPPAMQEEKSMAISETWTWRDLITPASVLTMGAIAVTVFACELRGIETRLTNMDSKIANLDAKIDGRGETVEQHLTQIDKRLDLGLDQQADMSSKINKIDTDLTFIHKRIDMLDQPKARGSNPPH